MTSAQKYYVFSLVLMICTAITVVILWKMTNDFTTSTTGFAMIALLVLGGRYFTKQHVVDERDKGIMKKADSFGHSMFWILFVAGSVAYIYTFGLDSTIPSRWLLFIVMIGAWIIVVMRSLSALYLYRKR